MPSYTCPNCGSTESSTIGTPDGHRCPNCHEVIAQSPSELDWS